MLFVLFWFVVNFHVANVGAVDVETDEGDVGVGAEPSAAARVHKKPAIFCIVYDLQNMRMTCYYNGGGCFFN